MKKISLLLVLSIVFFTLSGVTLNYSKKVYCGEVVEKYVKETKENKNERHIVFYCFDLKKNIDVQVKKSEFKNAKIKNSVCFELRKNQTR